MENWQCHFCLNFEFENSNCTFYFLFCLELCPVSVWSSSLYPPPVLLFLWCSRSLKFSHAFRQSDSCCCVITELSNCHSENDTHSRHQFSLPARVLGISGDWDECSLAALTDFHQSSCETARHTNKDGLYYIMIICRQHKNRYMD